MAPPDSPSRAWTIRPSLSKDRAQIRAIAVETADCGNPSPGLFGDRELLADWLTDYYLQREPRATFVAVEGEKVLGYLTGCLNTARYNKAMVAVSAMALWRAVKRGVFFRKETWATVGRAAGTAGRTKPYKNKMTVQQFPAHFHLNIRLECRGKGMGIALIDSFLSLARAAGVSGIHLGSRADNPFRPFFERAGFREAGRGRLPSWSLEGAAVHEVVLYVKDLTS